PILHSGVYQLTYLVVVHSSQRLNDVGLRLINLVEPLAYRASAEYDGNIRAHQLKEFHIYTHNITFFAVGQVHPSPARPQLLAYLRHCTARKRASALDV